jgi:hypothetical protein
MEKKRYSKVLGEIRNPFPLKRINIQDKKCKILKGGNIK